MKLYLVNVEELFLLVKFKSNIYLKILYKYYLYNMNFKYEEKYLKYKKKYLDLKNNYKSQLGGRKLYPNEIYWISHKKNKIYKTQLQAKYDNQKDFLEFSIKIGDSVKTFIGRMMPKSFRYKSKYNINVMNEDDINTEMINNQNLLFEEYKNDGNINSYIDIEYTPDFWDNISFNIPKKDDINNITTDEKLDNFYKNLYVNDGKKDGVSGIRGALGVLGFQKAATYCCDHDPDQSNSKDHAVGKNCKHSKNALCLARMGNILSGPNTSKFRCFSPNSDFPKEISKLEDKQKNCEVLEVPNFTGLA